MFDTMSSRDVRTYLENMSIHDVSAMRIYPGETDSRGIETECSARISTGEYFSKHFPDGYELMKSMSKNGVYLAGAQALEYFVPNSVDQYESWIFYIHHNEFSIQRFRTDMSQLGVKWSRLSDSNPGVGSTNVGILCTGDKTLDIRLVVEHRSPFEVLAPFNEKLSCMQAFIGPHSAGHMYGVMTHYKNTYKWKQHSGSLRRQNTDISRLCRNYGYHFVNYSDAEPTGVCRSITDENATFVVSDNRCNAPDDVYNAYVHITMCMSWYQDIAGTYEHDQERVWNVIPDSVYTNRWLTS